MFNISVVCFSLFIFTIVKCYDLNDELVIEDGPKISKHHNKIKPTVQESEVTTKITSNDEAEPNNGITEESPNINEQENKEFMAHDKFSRAEETVNENIKNDSILDTNDDAPRKVSKDTRRVNTDDDDESKSGSNFDEEIPEILKAEEKIENDSVNDEEPSTESGESIVYAPNRRTLSQDIVLDLKSRTGNGEADLGQTDDNLSTAEKHPRLYANVRTGYALPDYLDLDSKPADFKFSGSHQFRPNLVYKKELISQFYHPNDARPRIINSPPLNPHHRFSPLFYNSINSREMVFPHTNSREGIWGRGSTPRQMRDTIRPFFGYNYLKSPIYNPKDPYFRERCIGCNQGRSDRNYRRSAETDPTIYHTANGRSFDFEPTGANSYPFVPAADKTSEEIQRVQEGRAPSQEELRSSQELMSLPETDPPNYNQKDHPLSVNQDNQFSKMFMPFYNSQNLLNQRIGLRGLSRFGG